MKYFIKAFNIWQKKYKMQKDEVKYIFMNIKCYHCINLHTTLSKAVVLSDY